MKIIYVDLDNVLADFSGQANSLERWENEIGFFRNLEPMSANVKAIKILMQEGKQVRILSKSPNNRIDQEKLDWLGQYLPQMKSEHIHLCRSGQDKTEHAEDITNSLLLDDYGHNCRQWIAKGGQAIKIKDRMHIFNLMLDNVL